MKLFISRLILFFLIIFFISITSIITVNKVINHGDYFTIDKNVTSILLGHSHSECAFNDSLIKNFANFSQGGESYFYTYFKLKKITENNPGVKTVFIGFTNNQIEKGMDGWIWDDIHLSSRYPMYGSFMNFQESMWLFSHNSTSFLRALVINFKAGFRFLKKPSKNYIKEVGWGGYLYLERFNADTLLKAIPKNETDMQNNSNGEISKDNIAYLEKIIQYCRNKKIKMYLIRSPMHPLYSGIKNEDTYKEILNSSLRGTEFLDFKNFPLSVHEYGDLEHLNYIGAKRFSLFFNDIIQKGLLSSSDKQYVINQAFNTYAN